MRAGAPGESGLGRQVRAGAPGESGRGRQVRAGAPSEIIKGIQWYEPRLKGICRQQSRRTRMDRAGNGTLRIKSVHETGGNVTDRQSERQSETEKERGRRRPAGLRGWRRRRTRRRRLRGQLLDSPFVTRIRSVDPQDVYNAHCTFNLLDHDEKISGVAKFGQRTLHLKHYGPEFAADWTYNPT